VAALVLVATLGPRVRFQDRWTEPDVPRTPEEIAARFEEGDSDVPGLRAGDGAAVAWADPGAPAPTPLSIVYLHGFSADRHEIEPVVSMLGRDLGANVVFTRLRGHGRDGSAMADATVEAWLDDTAEAIAVGGAVGGRVVLVGTSTGGTLATWAAARPEAEDRLGALVLISPNYQPADRTSRVFLLPWGSLLARLIVGPERCFEPENEAQERHWTTCYPTSALATMMALVERVRTMDLSGVRVPTLVLYHPADRVVDEEETLRVVAGMTGTDPERHVVRSTSDPSRHVLAGEIMSPASSAEVRNVIVDFLETNGLHPRSGG
jgi:pimeloyl-ACP methyl ester carboxylesterase